MRKKIFTILLALAASVGMMNAKVTWNSSNISDLSVYGTRVSYSKEGVTLSSNADEIYAMWYSSGDESMTGIGFDANETGGFTFSNTLGKNFTKIEMTLNGPGGWNYANLGSGWSFSWNPIEDKPATVTWTGNAATVDLLKDESNFHAGDYVKSIVFYFEGDSEEATTAVTGVTLNKSAAEMTVGGATLTLIPTVLPSNATNKDVMWNSDNGYVAVVENGVVTAVGPGTANITVTTVDGNKSATCVVTVSNPAPTYTVALKEGTANADKVTLSATSAVEGATVTVTPDDEYEITAFKATYNTTEELSTSFNTETGAYSFTMPAYAVTIEATIALKPVPEGDVFAGFTATAGSGGFGGEGHANLVDNKFISSDWTKWCANDGHKSIPTGESESCWWIDFEASAALSLTGYILTTGNDTGSEHGRNPKNWVLKAKLNADDAWTTIATVDNDATMKNKSFKDYKFFVDKSGSYQYFRFEVFANQGAGVMQLCELRLIGTETPAPTPTFTLQLVADPEMGSVAVTNLLGSGIIDNGNGNYTVPENADVTIQATPLEGYEFTGWKAGDISCDFLDCGVALKTVENPMTIGLGRDVALMAEFAAVTPTPEGDGKLTGAFTINESGDQILFSKGNLQYQASTTTWRFATNQYDTIGGANINISDTYTGWIDLFGWGTGINPTNTSTVDEDYSTFTDWGVNAISNGGNEANLWRTLTIQEWGYLIKTRTNADNLKGQATVAGVHGYVLLPDSWNLPAGLSFTASPNNWTTNVYTAEQWTQMEAAGAVFLPAAGYRNPDIKYVDEKGWYWSSDVVSDLAAYDFEFNETTSRVFGCRIYFGLPVRLVTAAPDSGGATAIDNAKANAKAVKHIKDGQLFIIRDGKTYTVTGQQVR